jgi:hypothetical protein
MLNHGFRGIEYAVVQTSNPTGWKWTVHINATKTRSGDTFSKALAIANAELAMAIGSDAPQTP